MMSNLLCISLFLLFSHSLANPAGTNDRTSTPAPFTAIFTRDNFIPGEEPDFDEDLQIYNRSDAIPPQPENRVDPEFLKNLNNFHARLTTAVLKSKPGQNVIYSPIGFTISLMMVALGTRGSTLTEIFDTVGLDFNRETILGFRQVINILESTNGPKLHMANGFFVSTAVPLVSNYATTIKTILDADLRVVDFGYIERTAFIINQWCTNHTRDFVTNIVSPEDVTRLLLLSANPVFFSGGWSNTFVDSKTRHNLPFFVNAKKTVSVSMMQVEGLFNAGYISELKTKFFELPFKASPGDNDTFSMFVFCSRNYDDLNIFENSFGRIDYRRLNVRKLALKILLPKFSLRSIIEARPIFDNMGIKKLFSPRPDFGRLIDRATTNMDKIVQKTTLNIDEKGSDSTTVSNEIHTDSTIGSVTINKPFIIAIVSKSLGIPVIYGKVVDPTVPVTD